MNRKAHLARRTSLRMQQLDMFLKLMETVSIRATADIMGLTQFAVSKSLKELESTIGTALFERTASGLRPTTDSMLLERYAQDVIHGFNQLNRELHAQTSKNENPLNVGATAGGAHLLLMRLIRRSLGAPPVRIAARIEESHGLVERLADGALDVVIAYAVTVPPPSRICSVPAGHDSIVAVAHPLHPVFQDVRAYHHHPWMLPVAGEPIRQLIEQRMAEAGHALPKALVESSLGLTEPGLAMRDDVMVWTTRAVAAPWIARGDLRCVELPFLTPMLSYCAMRLRKHRLPMTGFTMWMELLRELRMRHYRLHRKTQLSA